MQSCLHEPEVKETYMESMPGRIKVVLRAKYSCHTILPGICMAFLIKFWFSVFLKHD